MANQGTTQNPAVGDIYFYMAYNKIETAQVMEIIKRDQLKVDDNTRIEYSYIIMATHINGKINTNYWAKDGKGSEISLDQVQTNYFDTREALIASL